MIFIQNYKIKKKKRYSNYKHKGNKIYLTKLDNKRKSTKKTIKYNTTITTQIPGEKEKINK